MTNCQISSDKTKTENTARNNADSDLKKSGNCVCTNYNCTPDTHIRPDVKTKEDAEKPPARRPRRNGAVR